jgi:translation initiation factor 2-alpha kinase 4
MCSVFTTGMERVTTINILKKEEKLPAGFETKHPNEAELIKWLLKRDPNQRPSAVQLMQSNLLPSKMEEEILKEALNTITNPSTTIFSNLMDKLWNLQNDKHLDYTYDYQTVWLT